MLPQTTKALKEKIIPKIASLVPSFGIGKKVSRNEKRIENIEAFTKEVAERLDSDFKQHSGAFDFHHQSSPTSTTPHVLRQLYGRDLAFLRQYYQVCSPIDQIIFQKTFEKLRNLSDCVGSNPKKIGWRVVHIEQDSPDFRVTKEIEQKSRRLEMLIKNVNKVRHPGGFPEVLIAMAESKMLFDRIPIEKLSHKQYQKNLPASYLIPDSATIKPTTWVLHAMAGSPGYSGINPMNQARIITTDSLQTARQMLTYENTAQIVAKQIASKNGGLGVQTEYDRLMSGVIQWVQQMYDNQVSAAYTADDISMFIGNPSPQVNAWGWSSGSAFERSFSFGEVIFKMTGLNKEIFDSRMPEGVLLLQNSGMDKKAKQQMHERMADEGSDRHANLLVQYVNEPDKDAKFFKMKDKPTDMQFQQMFVLYIKIKCSAYGFDYTELNLEDGKSGGLGGSGAHEKRMDNQAATGIQSDARYYAHCLTEALIRPWTPDYKMEFVHDFTETKEQIDLRKDKMAYKSVEETRVEDNLEDDWWKTAPKEYRDNLKELGQYLYIPGVSDTGRTQLMTKMMELKQQKEMQEQAEKEEAEQAGEEGGEEPATPEESKEIADLRSAIGEQDKENKELEGGMEKSFAVKVDHHWG